MIEPDWNKMSTTWGSNPNKPMSFKSKVVVGLCATVLFSGLAIGFAMPHTSECTALMNDADHSVSDLKSFDYRDGKWFTETGKLFGYAEFEDSIIYPVENCKPYYNEAK